jgi:hypothetical protein
MRVPWKIERLWQLAIGQDNDVRWSRVVMNQEMGKLVAGLPVHTLRALEISGENWKRIGFKSYATAHFPDYDVCAGPLPTQYDIIVADQVLEHVLWPYRAVKHVHHMLTQGGYFLVSTPFLVRVHNYPTDCSRWTELGLKHLLAEGGFPLDGIQTGSWGNRRCVVANFKDWTPYRSRLHDLRNEPDFPYSVWALAQKAS